MVLQQNGTERIRYFEGQLLAARDLQDDVAYESRMRGLHVRTLHNTWGVALGFAVSLTSKQRIEVGPGIAYDCQGREIISVRTFEVGLPVLPVKSKAKAWWFDLVIRYNELSGRSPGEGCLAGDVSPHEEQPIWRWVLAGEADDPDQPPPLEVADAVRLGEEIPLARFRITLQRQISQLDFGTRRHAQGLVRPHIAGGQVTGALTFNQTQHAFSIQVNTSSGGFNQTPFYFAQIALPFFLDPENLAGNNLEFVRRLLGPFVSIRAATRTRFTVDVRFAISFARQIGIARDVADAPTMAQATRENELLQVQVNWVGIEPNGGCPPPVQLTRFLLFATPIASFATRGSTRLVFG